MFYFVGEWDEMDNIVRIVRIVRAREDMVSILDRFRHMLEDFGGDLGVTGPVSGELVVDLK